MSDLPSAFFIQVSAASLSEPLADGIAKSMTVVTPPRAPARVPVR